MNNLAYLLALHSIDGLGPVRLKKVIDYFKDPKEAWDASFLDLRTIGIPQGVIEKIKEAKKNIDPESYAAKILSSEIKVLTIFDDDYPELLKKIYDPPVIIYYKGDIKVLSKKGVAIVGTRKITGYGRVVTEAFTKDLAKAGLVIVSGLARGVDTVAHQGAILANGKTAAVLGGGLNNIFPPENSSLAKKIADGYGIVLSEFPPDCPSLPGNFPSRNRIIAGLSLAVLVTEAALDSGSLITARIALEEGRDIYAVPGPITSNLSQGPTALIKEGAILVDKSEDILKNLGLDKKNNAFLNINLESLSEMDKKILSLLENETKHIDEIARELEIPSSDVAGSLIKMEILGAVKNTGAGIYLKV